MRVSVIVLQRVVIWTAGLCSLMATAAVVTGDPLPSVVARLPSWIGFGLVLAGALLLWLVSLLASAAPARNASRLPPALATRTV